MKPLSQEQIKRHLGEHAAKLILPKMKVGLGTGTTSHFFIEALGKRCREEHLEIKAAASSKSSADLAAKLGIPVFNIDQLGSLDITVDGADEVDPKKRMIKGAGGAHVREKIVAAMSKQLVIIVDESKLVDKLGKHKLPIEVLPFGMEVTKRHIEKLGLMCTWRMNANTKLLTTDNGNHLIDAHFPAPLDDPAMWEQRIRSIPGVVDTGFFLHLATQVLIGFSDGQITNR
jgi:ribose 5-phosphate isomerase A